MEKNNAPVVPGRVLLFGEIDMKNIDQWIVAQFAACQTQGELRQLDTALRNVDQVLTTARERNKLYNRLKNERNREIRQAELAPFEDKAKRWKKGQKVYFAKSHNSGSLDWNFNFIKGSGVNIKAGDWCYVWLYQPKAKSLWLCHPKKKCEYANVIRSDFSLNDIMRLGISRTEPAIRK